MPYFEIKREGHSWVTEDNLFAAYSPKNEMLYASGPTVMFPITEVGISTISDY